MKLRLRPPRTDLTAVIRVSTGLAVLAGLLLLLSGFAPPLAEAGEAGLSAAPLLLIGLAGLIVSMRVHARVCERARHLGVVRAFLMWGIDELLPPNALGVTLGHLVILLFVIDLALTMREHLAAR